MRINNIIFAIIVSLLLGGCNTAKESNISSSSSGNSSIHEHIYETTYSYDDEYHFFKAICGHDVVDKKEKHVIKEDKVEPTYDSEGYTLYSCTVCSYSYQDKKVDILQHNYSSEWKYDKTHHYKQCIDEGYIDLIAFKDEHKFKEETIAPTYEEEGYTLHICEVCKYNYKDNYINKLDHTYSTNWSYDNDSHWRECIDEGYTHLFIDKGNHDYQTSIIVPTEEEKGYTLHECKICSYSYKDNETEPLKKTYKVMFVTYDGYGVSDITANKGDLIYLPTPAKEGYAFAGWYKEESFTKQVRSFEMNEEDVTFYAKWIKTHEIFNMNSFRYIYMGEYPQTIVCNDKIIQELDKIETTNSSGYYVYDGIKYAKKNAVETRYCNNSFVVQKGQSYYFSVEPILWRILTSDITNTYTLLSEDALRASVFDNTSNNYANSYVRSFINNELYEEAFNEVEKSKITTSIVDNSAPTTNKNPNPFACEDTFDKVFLLSFRDYRNKSYGFLDHDMADKARLCRGSDYAISDGLARNSTYGGTVKYWTRSPISYALPEYDNASFIDDRGWTNDYQIISNFGVRVGININL